VEQAIGNLPGWEERRSMKASTFSDAQKAFILKQCGDGMLVADLCRKAESARRLIPTRGNLDS